MNPAQPGIPPMGHSPAAQATGNPGLEAQAIAQVREAIKLLSLALPHVPMEEKADLAKCVSTLSKKFTQSEAAPGIQQTQLRDLAQQAQQQQMMQALMRKQQAGGAPGDAAQGGAPQPQPQAA